MFSSRPAIPAFFAAAWLLPLGVAAAAAWSPWAAWGFMFMVQVSLALLERLPALRHAPAAATVAPGFRTVLRVHVALQAALLASGVHIALQTPGWGAIVALGIGVGGVTGSQGITFAHELGHSRSRLDRFLGWLLMGSVLYAHFMVEHYRGHHPRAATDADPASARAGESLWRFLPRTVPGQIASAWRLEARQLRQLKRGWQRSPLLWATAGQGALLVGLAAAFGPKALLFWVVQAVYAIFLLEAINYIEHYGLRRPAGQPFGLRHAWNADHAVTNALIANLQRHSDHHMHAWKPYETLEPLPGPQLPTGYAGCLFLASVPPLWFRAMRPRLQQEAVVLQGGVQALDQGVEVGRA
jgi:alkane 1-monooxygenase